MIDDENKNGKKNPIIYTFSILVVIKTRYLNFNLLVESQ